MLETRQLLSAADPNFLHSRFYRPYDVGLPGAATTLNNEGKVVTGRDRQGDMYVIKVTGPGYVVVSDATPNDGVLDDDIDTIQLVGTDPNRTRVVAQSHGSAIVPNVPGTILFNKLIAQTGVASVDLNGFILSQTVSPTTGTPNSDTGIFLNGGARELSFQGVEAPIDLALSSSPINIVIGDPQTPLSYKPSITIDQISNTVFDSTATTAPTGPQVFPTVNVTVNGEIHQLRLVSATQAVIDAADQYLFPIVGTTGRTRIQANGIDHLSARGSLKNTAISRGNTAFQNGLSGLNHLGTGEFGGTADALGIDVNGPVGKLKFHRGLGSPVGVSKAATNYGTPAAELGYPSQGLFGGLITSNSIKHVVALPANSIQQTSQNPSLIQVKPGSTRWIVRPGSALSSAAIVSSGSIGGTRIIGNATNSEVKAGYNYPSVVAGLQGTRARSHISPVDVRGDLIDSAISATYRPGNNDYNSPTSQVGNGTIKGRYLGSLYNTTGTTILGNQGTGFYAKHKSRHLQPPETPKRAGNGLLTR